MKPTILFFDSGVGGLSVYREVRQLLPDYHYLYCFDNAFFPYSERAEAEIIERVLMICQQLDQRYPLDLIVIACNTASTVVLPALRQAFRCPIVGTVPAIKPAAIISKTKHIGLLATKGTINRSYVAELICQYAKDCKVEKIGSTQLVQLAEQKLHGHSVDLIALRKELLIWLEQTDLDTVVLGCTHFPLLKEEIQICLPQVKYFVDSGQAIAKRIQSLLEDYQENKSEEMQALLFNQAFCTHDFSTLFQFERRLKQWGFATLTLL
ncbi:glutamate racemase [Volucribacter amazonae]|uniref:Glutamate racemase n=1 Tax=Volucribacter amazonae TaxID=256731 RepID=A0A9X4PC95_9PAST|nr:glutamate racemase [Volucribacter amazonae]MDG6894726.1 glutamate racemase [Volucribacter amazonae]